MFVFPNHFLFCFYFRALSSFNKPHSLPLSTLTCCPPFVIKVPAVYDLIYSQNSPASEESARPLFSKANQGPADQERFYLPWNSYPYRSPCVHGNFQFTKCFPLFVPVASSQPVCGGGIFITRVATRPAQHRWHLLSQPNHWKHLLSLSEVSWFGQFKIRASYL